MFMEHRTEALFSYEYQLELNWYQNRTGPWQCDSFDI